MKKKSAKACLNIKWFLALAIACLILSTSGCTSTIAPNKVVTHQKAFSGNDANGGFVGFYSDGRGVITDGARNKYNALIEIYSNKFLPPITKDFGVTSFTNTTHLITKEGLSDFMQMNQWYKDGKK